jgi:Tol biopolymer transport system component
VAADTIAVMPKTPKSKLIALLVAAAMLLALPAAAEAMLVFTRVPLQPVVWAANDDGSGAKPIGKGSYPRISPDGATVAYYRIQKAHGYRQEMVLSATDGSGSPRVLLPRWNEPFSFDWSPDSGTIVAVTGPELGKKRLVAIDVASGAQRTIAKGYFSGVSFAPSGTELAYAKSGSEKYPPKVDLYKFSLATGKSARLTKDHRSQYPLWGPTGTIVFVKLLNAQQRRYGPKNELFLMNEQGGQVKRLTHTKVGALLSGLSPTQWSDSGNELLAEFGGQDTTYAVTVNPRTGAERTLTDERETGFVGTALSADGSTVLGSIGGFEPGPGHKVVTIPYAGGKQTVLANNASEPDWNR